MFARRPHTRSTGWAVVVLSCRAPSSLRSPGARARRATRLGLRRGWVRQCLAWASPRPRPAPKEVPLHDPPGPTNPRRDARLHARDRGRRLGGEDLDEVQVVAGEVVGPGAAALGQENAAGALIDQLHDADDVPWVRRSPTAAATPWAALMAAATPWVPAAAWAGAMARAVAAIPWVVAATPLRVAISWGRPLHTHTHTRAAPWDEAAQWAEAAPQTAAIPCGVWVTPLGCGDPMRCDGRVSCGVAAPPWHAEIPWAPTPWLEATTSPGRPTQ